MNGNYLNLSFCIWEYDDIDDQEISLSLGLSPSIVYNRGQPIDSNRSMLAEYNGCVFHAFQLDEDAFEDQMNNILDILETKIPLLQVYAQKYDCEFLCLVLLNNREESTPWIHFDKRYNGFIRQVNVRFNLRVCFSYAEEAIRSYYGYKNM